MIQPQDHDLHRLTYLSSAPDEVSQQQLDAILEASRANNPRQHVTGLLLYHDCQFFQALEGPRAQVEEIFARIKADRRHNGCLVLESRSVESRFFDKWSMAYKSVSSLGAAEKQNFLDLTGVRGRYAASEAVDGARTRILMDSFLSSLRDVDLD
jgi:hypothetical protein